MRRGPYSDERYPDDEYQNQDFQPGEILPTDIRPDYRAGAMFWIACAVALVIGGAMLIGLRHASTPNASIEPAPLTAGSASQAQ